MNLNNIPQTKADYEQQKAAQNSHYNYVHGRGSRILSYTHDMLFNQDFLTEEDRLNAIDLWEKNIYLFPEVDCDSEIEALKIAMIHNHYILSLGVWERFKSRQARFVKGFKTLTPEMEKGVIAREGLVLTPKNIEELKDTL